MARLLRISIFLLGTLLGFLGVSEGWIHPGISNTRAQLELMADKVTAGADPWHAMYNRVPTFANHVPTAPGTISLPADGAVANALLLDADAAYGSALQWVITGNIVRCNKARQILLDYVNSTTSITGSAARLFISWYFPRMIFAAEILRHMPGTCWTTTDHNNWIAWGEQEVSPIIYGQAIDTTGNNWDTLQAHARMAWATHTENLSRFMTAQSNFQALVGWYIGRHQAPADVFAGFTYETCRGNPVNANMGTTKGSDLSHVTMGLGGLLATAEVMKHQRPDNGNIIDGYAFVGADGWGIRTALLGHSQWFGYPNRPGSALNTPNQWPCALSPLQGPGGADTPNVRQMWMAVYNHYRDSIFLTLSNYYGPMSYSYGQDRASPYIWNRMTHNYFGLADDGEAGPGPGPTPTTPQTWVVSTTGTGTACTAAGPCSISQAMTAHHGGDTIKLGDGTYAFECNDCLKSGTAGQPTILESLNRGAAITVGKDKLSVTPGLATLSGNTGITLWIKEGQHDITVRHLNCTTTGAGTNPCIQIADQATTSTNAATDLIFENMDIQAPTRIGATAAVLQRGTNGSARVKWDRVRIHHAGAAVNFSQSTPTTSGLRLNGPDHSIINSDFSSNQRHGISARCEGCTQTKVDRLTITGSRFLGNGYHGIDVGEGTDQHIANNVFTGNGGTSVLINSTSTRATVYNNTSYANSQLTGVTAHGLYVATGATGVVRNNIAMNHPLGAIFVGSLASQVACSNNLTDAATGSATCTTWTLNAVPTDTWEDPNHATLTSRDFALKAGSDAIDNGTTGICTSADTSANRCTPALTVQGANATPPDQGALESGFTAQPAVGALIASYTFDTDMTDSTTFNNDGTATSVTIDGTNRIGGAGGSAFFNATTDRVTVPLNGLSLTNGITNGLSVALSARAATLGTQAYLFGHTSVPPSYSSRVQIKKNASNKLMFGIGGSIATLTTNFVFEANTFYRIVLVLTPGTTAGTGTMTAWVDGVPVGSASYTGLNTLGTGATIGNNDGEQIEGWNGQIDELRLWNYPITGSEISADCDSYCVEPIPPDEQDLFLGAGTIGPFGDNVTSVQIILGADPTKCSPLSGFQVTYDGVAQTETSCSITGTNPSMLRITTSAVALQGQVVLLTYQDQDPITISNQIQGGGTTFDPLVLTSCTTDITGLSVICQTQGTPNPNVCNTLSHFVARDACAAVALNSCSMTTTGVRVLTLRRVAPPLNGTVGLDLIYSPTDQRIGITNLFDPSDPEIPPITALAQTQWRCRPDGPDASTPWQGRPNKLCEAPSPGGINLRIAIANTSGTPMPDFGTSLFCARQDAGEAYTNFMRVGASFGSLGLRFGEQTPHGVPDGALLAEAALPLDLEANPLLQYAPIGGFRRQELQFGRPTLGDDQQLEEEYALETGPTATALPIGTRFSCRAHDRVGNPLTSYTGLAGCTNDPEPFTGGEVPCGVPIAITAPSRRGR